MGELILRPRNASQAGDGPHVLKEALEHMYHL